MPPSIARNRVGIKTQHASLPEEIRAFFPEVPELIDSSFSLDILLAYLFFRIEQGQRLTLYCGARKLHRTESTLTWKAIDSHDLTRAGFRDLFRTIYGFDMDKAAADSLADAEKIRDKLMHGKVLTEKDKREAISKVMHYAKEVNDLIAVKKSLGFKPFCGDLRGFVGRLEPLDRSTTRWILKGMGFAIL
jgi:hypothetical protein